MSFSSENGYEATTIDAILDSIRIEINNQFNTSYTAQSFVGTNFYKYFYALAQKVQENEVKTSEIFTYLQQYFAITNESIQRPVATAPGIIEALEREGYIASVKRTIEAEAGKVFICVQIDGYEFATKQQAELLFQARNPGIEGNNISIILADTATAGSETISIVEDQITIGIESGVSTTTQIRDALAGDALADLMVQAIIDSGEETTPQNAVAEFNLESGSGEGYLTKKAEIGTIIQQSVAAGLVTQGDQVENLVLTNGQDFDFKYVLPNIIDVNLRLSIHTSDNNQVVIQTPEEVKQKLIDNIAKEYRLGRDFEPQKYFNFSDAPWSATILLEYSLNGGVDWLSTVYESNYDDLFNIALENIELVES